MALMMKIMMTRQSGLESKTGDNRSQSVSYATVQTVVFCSIFLDFLSSRSLLLIIYFNVFVADILFYLGGLEQTR